MMSCDWVRPIRMHQSHLVVFIANGIQGDWIVTGCDWFRTIRTSRRPKLSWCDQSCLVVAFLEASYVQFRIHLPFRWTWFRFTHCFPQALMLYDFEGCLTSDARTWKPWEFKRRFSTSQDIISQNFTLPTFIYSFTNIYLFL